jgi:hypothetical protein
MPKIAKELESAILNLSPQEKDKMLLKLIAKNDVLIDQLYFKLLEDESDLKEKRQNIKDGISESAQYVHYSPGLMMMSMRDLNGHITRHVKITKDKYGEVELTLYLLNTFFEHQLPHLKSYTRHTDTIAQYIGKRTEFVLNKFKKLHEDYHIEFGASINLLLKRVHTYCPAYYAQQLKLPKEWDE